MANTYLLSDEAKRYLCCYYQILDGMIQSVSAAIGGAPGPDRTAGGKGASAQVFSIISRFSTNARENLFL